MEIIYRPGTKVSPVMLYPELAASARFESMRPSPGILRGERKCTWAAHQDAERKHSRHVRGLEKDAVKVMTQRNRQEQEMRRHRDALLRERQHIRHVTRRRHQLLRDTEYKLCNRLRITHQSDSEWIAVMPLRRNRGYHPSGTSEARPRDKARAYGKKTEDSPESLLRRERIQYRKAKFNSGSLDSDNQKFTSLAKDNKLPPLTEEPSEASQQNHDAGI